jgi:hypothetical protein
MATKGHKKHKKRQPTRNKETEIERGPEKKIARKAAKTQRRQEKSPDGITG